MFRIGIFIYEKVEILDFCGPFEVFNGARHFAKDQETIEVVTVAPTKETINAQGLLVIPNYSIKDCPPLNILLIPGGDGVKLAENKEVSEWIIKVEPNLKHLLTVCTGSLLLAKNNFLSNKKATSHHSAISKLKKYAPDAIIDISKRYIDNGKIIIAAGISAGIDMSLYVCEKLWGQEVAINIANYMEYNWNRSEENFLDRALY
jgi:transcriptional regulator GlxA family with amidase domain